MAPKKQVQKMSLGDFLGDQNLGSWADEMEDMPIPSESRTGYGDRRAVSGYASMADRGYDRGPPREALPLPTKPPYTAHLGNLPFDASSVDVENFFNGCQVTSVRIVEDKIDHRPKGFGYVEFGTLDGLKAALELNGTPFNGRNIKISVADPPKDRADAREITDWSRKGPLPELPQAQRRVSERTFGSGGGGGGRNYEAPDMERGGSRRGAPPPEGDGKSRDFSNWERRGPLSPIPGAEPVRGPGRVRNLEGEERRNSPSWGEGRSQDGSRTRPGPGAEVRDRPPPPERKPTAAEQDNEWRARMRPDPPIKSKTPTPDPSTPSSPSHAPAPAGRPKLNLAKRTVSEAQPASTHESASGDAKASPFGAARPIDTAAREREVEEKRQAALKEKKEEAEEKALEEKKTREVAPKSAVPKEAEEGSVSADGKTNGSEEPEASNITVLSRPKDGDNIEKEKANGSERPIPTHPRNRGPPREPREPREPRGPREPRESRDPNDPPRGPRNNAGPRDWRRKTSGGPGQSNPASPVTPAAGPDDDGWSTVAPKQKGGPKGRGSNAPRTTAA